MPPAPLCGRWPMSRARLRDEPEPDHLVVAPERAVHQHAIRACIASQTVLLGRRSLERKGRSPCDFAGNQRARYCRRAAATSRLGEYGRRFAGDWQPTPPDTPAPRRSEIILEIDPAAVDAAVVREDLQDRVAACQVGVYAIRAPQGPRAGGLSQHVESGRVIDLPVAENDPDDGGIANSPRGL